MNHEILDEYDKEINMKFISFLAYQVHTMDPMLFCVDTEAPISYIGDKSQKRIVYSVCR